VKTSLAPGSQVVAEYLEKSGLQEDLDKLGFNLVGFGCTTCIGNSGPLPADLQDHQRQGPDRLPACSRATATSKAASRPDVQANYLASPPLVVAYALAGTVQRT
jgi:aconitate hydratase